MLLNLSDLWSGYRDIWNDVAFQPGHLLGAQTTCNIGNIHIIEGIVYSAQVICKRT